jgi:hypothetical protein
MMAPIAGFHPFDVNALLSWLFWIAEIRLPI